MMLPLTTSGLVRYVSLDMVYENIVFFSLLEYRSVNNLIMGKS